MWNQREALHKFYENIEDKHIPALFGKGRPFDADHIMARGNLLGGEIHDDILKAGCKYFLGNDSGLEDKYFLPNWLLRKQVPNMNGNYRFWPKRLNRSDGNNSVENKMELEKIKECLSHHSLSHCFENENSDIAWRWSIMSKNEGWEKLPPAKNTWEQKSIEQFIRVILNREYQLYNEAYKFLTLDVQVF